MLNLKPHKITFTIFHIHEQEKSTFSNSNKKVREKYVEFLDTLIADLERLSIDIHCSLSPPKTENIKSIYKDATNRFKNVIEYDIGSPEDWIPFYSYKLVKCV